MEDEWNACLQTLEGHSSYVSSVTWSHDAARLASASWDHTVKIWEAATGRCVSTLEIGRTATYLQFDKARPNRLHTNVGTFDVRPTVPPTVVTAAFPEESTSTPQPLGFGLNSNRTWITYKGQNLLWLPPEYRRSSSAISGTGVAIGCRSGRVLLLRFSKDDPVSLQG